MQTTVSNPASLTVLLLYKLNPNSIGSNSDKRNELSWMWGRIVLPLIYVTTWILLLWHKYVLLLNVREYSNCYQLYSETIIFLEKTRFRKLTTRYLCRFLRDTTSNNARSKRDLFLVVGGGFQYDIQVKNVLPNTADII